MAAAAVLTDNQFIPVIHSQPTWEIVSESGAKDGNWLSADEALVVMGLVSDYYHPVRFVVDLESNDP